MRPRWWSSTRSWPTSTAPSTAIATSDVRRAIAPLSAIAERTGACIALVRHLNKTSGGPALYRGGGASGSSEPPALLFLLPSTRTTPTAASLRRSRATSQSLPQAFAFRIVEHPCSAWRRSHGRDPTCDTADALLAKVANEPPANRRATHPCSRLDPRGRSGRHVPCGGDGGCRGDQRSCPEEGEKGAPCQIGQGWRPGSRWVLGVVAALGKGFRVPRTRLSLEDEPLRELMSALTGDAPVAASAGDPTHRHDEVEDGTLSGLDMARSGWTISPRESVAVLSVDRGTRHRRDPAALETRVLVGHPPMFLGPGVEVLDVERPFAPTSAMPATPASSARRPATAWLASRNATVVAG